MRLGLVGGGDAVDVSEPSSLEITALATVLRGRFRSVEIFAPDQGSAAKFAAVFALLGGVVSWTPAWGANVRPPHLGSDRVTQPPAGLPTERLDALLCLPGGFATWAVLLSTVLSTDAAKGTVSHFPIFLYSWEKYYAPLALQIETALEHGLVEQEAVSRFLIFESIEGLLPMLPAGDDDQAPATPKPAR